MVMCSKCHKRLAVVFVSRMENGQRSSEGLCIKCAKEAGIPVNNMLGDMAGQLGISPEQLESMEDGLSEFMTPSDNDDNEDGGAP
ncbi:MAG: ATP-dependent Clp protease ATP-binding subunit, partial [Ruminococcaceae bacterium]|nr:ATP-dependent Clp protease ATP-binding subunit [Oscillospiraceae bacterium]